MYTFLKLLLLSKWLFALVRSGTFRFPDLLPGDAILRELNLGSPHHEEKIYDVEEASRLGIKVLSEPSSTLCGLQYPIDKIVAYFTEDEETTKVIGLDPKREPSLYQIRGAGEDIKLVEKIAVPANSSFLFAKLYRDYDLEIAYRVYYITPNKQLMYLDSSISREVDNPSEFVLEEGRDYRVAKAVHLCNFTLLHIQSKGGAKFETSLLFLYLSYGQMREHILNVNDYLNEKAPKKLFNITYVSIFKVFSLNLGTSKFAFHKLVVAGYTYDMIDLQKVMYEAILTPDKLIDMRQVYSHNQLDNSEILNVLLETHENNKIRMITNLLISSSKGSYQNRALDARYIFLQSGAGTINRYPYFHLNVNGGLFNETTRLKPRARHHNMLHFEDENGKTQGIQVFNYFNQKFESHYWHLSHSGHIEPNHNSKNGEHYISVSNSKCILLLSFRMITVSIIDTGLIGNASKIIRLPYFRNVSEPRYALEYDQLDIKFDDSINKISLENLKSVEVRKRKSCPIEISIDNSLVSGPWFEMKLRRSAEVDEQPLEINTNKMRFFYFAAVNKIRAPIISMNLIGSADRVIDLDSKTAFTNCYPIYRKYADVTCTRSLHLNVSGNHLHKFVFYTKYAVMLVSNSTTGKFFVSIYNFYSQTTLNYPIEDLGAVVGDLVPSPLYLYFPFVRKSDGRVVVLTFCMNGHAVFDSFFPKLDGVYKIMHTKDQTNMKTLLQSRNGVGELIFGIDNKTFPEVKLEKVFKVDSYSPNATATCALRASSLLFEMVVIYTDGERLYYIREGTRDRDEVEIGIQLQRDSKIIDLHCLEDHLLLVETEKYIFTLSMSDDLSKNRFYFRRVWKNGPLTIEQIYSDMGVVYYSTLNRRTGERCLYWLNPAGTSFLFDGNDTKVDLEFLPSQSGLEAASTQMSILHLDPVSQQLDLAKHLANGSVTVFRKNISLGITLADTISLNAHLLGFQTSMPNLVIAQNRFSFIGSIKFNADYDFLDGYFFSVYNIFLLRKKLNNRIFVMVERNEKFVTEKEVQEERGFVVTAQIVDVLSTEDDQGRPQVRIIVSVGTIENTFKVHIFTVTVETQKVVSSTVCIRKSHRVEAFFHKWDYFVSAVDDMSKRLVFYHAGSGKEASLNTHRLEDLKCYRLVKLKTHLIVFAITEEDSDLKVMSTNMDQLNPFEAVSLQSNLDMSRYHTLKCRVNPKDDTFSCLFAGDLLHLISFRFDPKSKELIELSKQEYAVYLNMRVEDITLEQGYDFFILKCSRAVLEEEHDMDDQMAILYYPIINSSNRIGYVLGGMLKSELIRFNISPRFEITVRSSKQIVLHEEGRQPVVLMVEKLSIKGMIK